MTVGPQARRIGLALAIAAVAAGGAWSIASRPAAVPDGIVGHPAPAFELPDLVESSRKRAPRELLGQVWLLNAWASWCAPCREEHAVLLEAARADGARILGLNQYDDPRAAQEWLRRLGDPYLATAVDRDGAVGRSYGVPGLPVTFVVDRMGIVRHRHVGPVTQELWERELRPLVRRLQGGAA